MKKVSQEQLIELHVFIKKKYVEFYDVEIELVDHLAHAIEQQWVMDPMISFEKALEIEYKKFGVFGFSSVVEQKQSELSKHYWNIALRAFISYFTIPKIIITVALFLLLLVLGVRFPEYSYIYYRIIFYGLFVVTLVDGFINIRSIKKRQKLTGKKWLIESVSYSYFMVPLGLVYVYPNTMERFLFNTSQEILHVTLTQILVISVFLTLYILVFSISIKVIRPRLQSEQELTIKRHQFIN